MRRTADSQAVKAFISHRPGAARQRVTIETVSKLPRVMEAASGVWCVRDTLAV